MAHNKSLFSLMGVILFHLFLSCTGEPCKLPNGNATSELLGDFVDVHNHNYCDILKSALNGDDSSIRELVLLNFTGAAGYDHGSVLIEVIEQVGVKEFIKAIKNTSNVQRKLIEGYLDVGLMYGFREEYQNKSLNTVYPELYYFLNRK